MKRFINCTTLMVALFFTNFAFAGGILDPKLQQMMASESGPFQVIVTFKSLNDVNSLVTLVAQYYPLTTLPMTAAVLTKAQINQVLAWNNVESVYFNDQLEYSNYDAGEITGAHYVQNTLGVKGNGQTILVIDSGIDATHPDLAFGSKVIQNVKIVSDLATTGLVITTEGVINTDNTSGHGTHVSGTAGGTGTVSADDERDPFYYRGVAPEASLIGVGAGETLVILHALAAFDYAIANKDRYSIDIITNSWGNTSSNFDPNNPISRATHEAYRQGIVVAFAAGNEGPNDNTMSSYAINPWVIGVAAGDKSKGLADFSSRGEAGDPFEHPDVTAPGVAISSTRAIGSPVGALGPVINPNHPEYTIYYHTISGTSMATPFVAGTAALLLNANPNLSPDQIEDIITSTADPMPGLDLHQVGAGYINVRKAVELAQTTSGNRLQFLAGDTKWSSQGNWFQAEENNSNAAYYGKWTNVSNANASGGTYKRAQATNNKKPSLQLTFFGKAIKLEYPTQSDGGVAQVLLDGVSQGNVNFYSNSTQWKNRIAFAGLENEQHTLTLRALNGKIFIDKIYVDGALFPANTQFVDVVTTYTGIIGPSVNGIPETNEIQIAVSSNTIQIQAELQWSPAADLDLYLLDPSGAVVAQDASLNNPEALSHWVDTPGIYTYRIVGFAALLTSYTLTSTLTQTNPLKQSHSETLEETAENMPMDFKLFPSYPNPFNPETNIRYQLPLDGEVILKVFDIQGKEVATLVNGRQPAGNHGVRFDAKNLPSGIYFYKIKVSGGGRYFTNVNRMMLIK